MFAADVEFERFVKERAFHQRIHLEWGCEDGCVNLISLERLEKTLTTKYTGTHLVDGAGHWVQQEQPEALSRLLLDFLAHAR